MADRGASLSMQAPAARPRRRRVIRRCLLTLAGVGAVLPFVTFIVSPVLSMGGRWLELDAWARPVERTVEWRVLLNQGHAVFQRTELQPEQRTRDQVIAAGGRVERWRDLRATWFAPADHIVVESASMLIPKFRSTAVPPPRPAAAGGAGVASTPRIILAGGDWAVFPLWPLALPSLALASWWMIRVVRRWQHRMDGLCEECGYTRVDLPAGAACPECGAKEIC